MPKHRTIFGSPAIGKLRPMPLRLFRCRVTRKIKIMGYAISLVTDKGLAFQFASSQMYWDQNRSPVDLSGRTCDLSLLEDFVDVRGVHKQHDVKRLLLFAQVLHLNFQFDSEYSADALARLMIPQLNEHMQKNASWFAPAGVTAGYPRDTHSNDITMDVNFGEESVQ